MDEAFLLVKNHEKPNAFEAPVFFDREKTDDVILIDGASNTGFVFPLQQVVAGKNLVFLEVNVFLDAEPVADAVKKVLWLQEHFRHGKALGVDKKDGLLKCDCRFSGADGVLVIEDVEPIFHERASGGHQVGDFFATPFIEQVKITQQANQPVLVFFIKLHTQLARRLAKLLGAIFVARKFEHNALVVDFQELATCRQVSFFV